MSQINFADILELPIPDRIQLVEEIWESIAEVPEAVALTPEQKGELDRRLSAYHENPAFGSPWSEVKARILAR